MKQRILVAAAAITALPWLAACSSTADTAANPSNAEAPATTTATTVVTETSTATVAPSTESRSTEAAGGKSVMPNVVCMNLQAAQDTIQEAGVFFSRSTDATGQGRRQVLDRNWIVVGQTPDAGSEIGEGDAVLSVVKNDEPNDCPG